MEYLSQIIKRKSKPGTKAGQYMCPECGQVFNTKKEVDTHIRKLHELIWVQRRIVETKILEFLSFLAVSQR